MIEKLFSKDVVEIIKTEISASDGNEVFFVGNCNNDGLLEDVKVLARGNKFSVPAIIDSAKSGQIVIHNHPSGNLTPSGQDIFLASIFGNNGVGFFIIDNCLSDVYVVVEPFKKKECIKLDLTETRSYLIPGGPISNVLKESYEFRKEQIIALDQISTSFNNNTVELIEAGTGTGKTFSYLIPSILWAIKNNERVVVSTNTINLQEQLIGKDIPILVEAVSEQFKYSLVKGMRNYLCLLRMETLTDGQKDLFDEEELGEINDLIAWSKVTDEGSLSDLNFTPSEEVWDKISAENDSCIRAKCPYYSECFFFKHRREIASSQLLIVNHHLFFSDLAIKIATEDDQSGVLPPYRRAIFDEAHNIVDTASSHFSSSVSKYGLLRTVKRLKNRGKRGEIKGLVYYCASTAMKLSEKRKNVDLINFLYKAEEVVSPRVDHIVSLINESFDLLREFIIFTKDSEGKSGKDFNIRITEDILSKTQWETAKLKFNDLKAAIRDLIDEIQHLVEMIEQSEDKTEILKILVEFRSIVNKLHYYTEVIDAFFSERDDLNVKWIDFKTRNENFFSTVGVSPIDISDHLKKKLYKNLDMAILTSATLAIDKSFEFNKSQMGLDELTSVNELLVSSPFNFKEQALLCIPTDVPEPYAKDYSQKISQYLKELLLITNGSALLLFTSYELLNTVHSNLKEELLNTDMNVLIQGTEPRNKLINKFKRIKNSVLFATDSFWEGIDVTGDSLKLVVIMRLPFKVPTNPIFEARAEYLENQGINSFLEYFVPHAVIRFKQGFGRLIRSKTDKGVVVVLDKRIVTKSYGRYFLNSLPDCNVVSESFKDVLNRIRLFF